MAAGARAVQVLVAVRAMQHAFAERAGATTQDGAQGVALCVGEGCAVLRVEFGEALAKEIGEAFWGLCLGA